jgi:hypothetical protein
MSFQDAAVPPPALRGRCAGRRDAYEDGPVRAIAGVGATGSRLSSFSLCRLDCKQVDRTFTTPADAMNGNDKAVSAASVDSCVNARAQN